MNTAQKTCFKCGAEKPLADYYRHKGMADGHLNKCKSCTKNDTWQRRHNSSARDRVLEYDRARGNRQSADYLREYRKRYPKKYRAHSSVSKAIRDGKLERQLKCEECASDFHVEAHHDDYDKPLDVRWLCAACHKQWHATNGEAKNPF